MLDRSYGVEKMAKKSMSSQPNCSQNLSLFEKVTAPFCNGLVYSDSSLTFFFLNPVSESHSDTKLLNNSTKLVCDIKLLAK